MAKTFENLLSDKDEILCGAIFGGLAGFGFYFFLNTQSKGKGQVLYPARITKQESK